MKPKTIAAVILTAIAFMIAAEFAARSQSFNQTKKARVRWKKPSTNGGYAEATGYLVKIWPTNGNPSTYVWTTNTVETNAPFEVPNSGPWAVSVAAYSTWDTLSEWSTPTNFGWTASPAEIRIEQVITITLP